ncbi:glycosyltransferase family 39 protein [Polymorphum gilvum]|uniref:Hypothetical conserved membrane protein n=1 Tax=Polymorphum gilvum (strain LMG 25793 / CGMCC 1.9160 / SL003B-26A1) TaxID=991905 RepID=F2J3K2_POLGS|nr:glycosyltransferase family 39 protein [Polymorphum gilvum]ADZ71026.1 Hypothetical conserved membrane protein [Polymorphum gilvum SL003B-26A1]
MTLPHPDTGADTPSGARSDGLPPYAGAAGVVAVVAAWGLAHTLLRGLASPVLGTDDMLENVFVQSLEAGYLLRQPPLYEWLLWTLQQALGPTIWSFLLLKYALLTVAALFLFLVARRAIDDPRVAGLCVLSYSLLYQFGWNLHEGVTHTLVLTAACAASAWALLRAMESGRLAAYVPVGLAVGAGLLAKHSYPLFLSALLAAAVSDRAWRPRLRVAGLALALAVAAAVYAPYLAWTLGQGHGIVTESAGVMGTAAPAPHLQRAGTGLALLAWSLTGFSMPFLAIVVALFWPQVRAVGTGAVPRANDVARLCGRATVVAVAVTALLIVATGATYVKERHMHAVLLLLPIWLFARIAAAPGAKRWRALGLTIAAVAAVALVARVPGLVIPERLACGGKCRPLTPYAEIRDDLAALGAGQATLVGDDAYTAGNLRVLFPTARVAIPAWRPPLPPRAACLYVWDAGEAPPAAAAADAFVALFSGGRLPVRAGEARYLAGAWSHPWKPEGFRVTHWGVQPLDAADPLCQ